jgi:hypothetical protein
MCLNESCSKHLSGVYSIHSNIWGLLSFFSIFPLEITIKKVEESQEGLELDGMFKILVYADRLFAQPH